MTSPDSIADRKWLERLFAGVDRAGVEGIRDSLCEDVAFRFGSYPAGESADAFAAAWAAMEPAIAGLSHEILEHWRIDDTVCCRGNVTYRRRDASEVTVPFCNLFTMRGDRIQRYLIYVDASEVFS